MNDFYTEKFKFRDSVNIFDIVIYYGDKYLTKGTVEEIKDKNLFYIKTEDGRFIWTDVFSIKKYDDTDYYIDKEGNKKPYDFNALFMMYDIDNVYQLEDLIKRGLK